MRKKVSKSKSIRQQISDNLMKAQESTVKSGALPKISNSQRKAMVKSKVDDMLQPPFSHIYRDGKLIPVGKIAKNKKKSVKK